MVTSLWNLVPILVIRATAIAKIKTSSYRKLAQRSCRKENNFRPLTGKRGYLTL